jgi:hemoglobin
LEGDFRQHFFSRLALTAQHMINTPEKDMMKGESK